MAKLRASLTVNISQIDSYKHYTGIASNNNTKGYHNILVVSKFRYNGQEMRNLIWYSAQLMH